MDDALLEKLKAVDHAILTDVVQRDQRDPGFEITDWSVKRLSDKGIINPDGLWCFSGEGNTGGKSKSWSVVLKIIQRSEEDASPDDLWYWKRELLMVQSGLLEQMPGPVKAPRYYRIDETPSGAWLWQEFVRSHRPEPWTINDYAFAAHQLGLWNGAYACGAPMSDEPWLTRHYYSSWYSETNPERDFQFALNQKYIHGELRQRYDRLWSERESFYQALETLPQVFSYMDSQRRNLFIRGGENGQDELVIIDWALCGHAALGAEMYGLIGMSAALMEFPATQLVQLDHAAFPAYMRGLVEAGWTGNPDAVRLAYTAWMTVWLGVVFPSITALWCTPDRSFALQQFGQAEEELFLSWLPIFSYCLDCADESRMLMQKLDFA